MTFNSELAIGPLLDDLGLIAESRSEATTVVVVNNGSTDRTIELVSDRPETILRRCPNVGYEPSRLFRRYIMTTCRSPCACSGLPWPPAPLEPRGAVNH